MFSQLDVKAIVTGLVTAIFADLLLSNVELLILTLFYPTLDTHHEFLTKTPLLLISLISSLLTRGLSGLVTARMSRAAPVFNVVVLALSALLIFMIGFFLAVADAIPLWYSLIYVGLLVPVTYFGGILALPELFLDKLKKPKA